MRFGDAKEEVKTILEQKTVTTKRLIDIFKAFDRFISEQGQKINGQRNNISQLQIKLDVQKRQLEKKKKLVQDYEDLQAKHKRVLNQFRELETAYKRLKEK